jgi:GMP synthase (glutamine-hydrolysing)
MVTARLPWSEQTAAWIPTILREKIPMLGICYGHQLIAHAMGGVVGNNPQGSEYGTVHVHLSPYAHDDPLFQGLPPDIRGHVSHFQSVLRLPRRAKRIASSQSEKHQAYFLPPSAWGVQFHPEFSERVMSKYVAEFADVLRSEGKDPDKIQREITATPISDRILKKFSQIAFNGLG